MLSINLLSKDFLAPGSAHSGELRERLTSMNQRFDALCSRVAEWQGALRRALVSSADYQHTIEDLLKWMAGLERKLKDIEPVVLRAERETLQNKYDNLKVGYKVFILQRFPDQWTTGFQGETKQGGTGWSSLVKTNIQALLALTLSLVDIGLKYYSQILAR